MGRKGDLLGDDKGRAIADYLPLIFGDILPFREIDLLAANFAFIADPAKRHTNKIPVRGFCD